MSYTLYDFDKGEPLVYNGKMQHIEGSMIEPEPGDENPYRYGAVRDTELENRDYQIYVVQESSARIGPDGIPAENTLVIPDDSTSLSLFIRVYLSEFPGDYKGGVDLPQIRAYNEQTGRQIVCPSIPDHVVPETLKELVNREELFDPELIPRDEIQAFRPGNFGLFPNGNYPYLCTPLRYRENNDNKVAVVSFKAPTFPRTLTGGDDVTYSENDQVRYWSVCLGGWRTTNTSTCIPDEEMKIDQNGIVRIAVGPPTLTAPANSDWNLINWGAHLTPILIYRQIAPNENFDQSFYAVETAFNRGDQPTLDEIMAKKASNYIDEYAPSGKYCTIEEFERDGCGL
jgi:hypothetical protein